MTSPSRSPSPTVPQCPNGLFHFPSDSVLVTDADEDVSLSVMIDKFEHLVLIRLLGFVR